MEQSTRMPSQRQLRVGEELRSALALIFSMGESHIPELDSASITVSEVRVSPDLKNATAYVMPLAGNKKELVMEVLKEHAGHIRGLLSKRIVLRYTPKLVFKLDVSYEVAGRINQLLNSDRVKADLDKKNES